MSSVPENLSLILDNLNDNQREAVVCCDAPSLVIAGAGSGKTRVLTYKIAYLMQMGMEPWRILALTFTNKAAKEMRERIGQLVGAQEASMLWMGTFHSMFCRMLRYESHAIGFTSHFTIYDDRDSLSLIKNIIREKGLDEKQYRPGVVAHRISEAKNELLRPADYAADYRLTRRDQAGGMGMIHDIYATYQSRLQQSDAMDFDDLLLHTYVLLTEHPDIREKYEERFEFVLVDEYQDTNYAQHRIVWLLTAHRQRVSVVGDDAQSIYSFRGARIDNILTFEDTYNGARLFKLEQNYRSTQTIVKAANSVIRHNSRQIEKNVRSEQGEGQPIEVWEAYSDKEETAIVARKIHELVDKGPYSYGQIAILYRTNEQSRVFEEEFLRRKYPYVIYGGISFYQRKEIKDALAYLRLVVNPRDEEALRRVINYPARGIGKTTLDKIFMRATELEVPPFAVVSDPVGCGLDVNGGIAKRLQAFSLFVKDFAERVGDEQADEVAIKLLKESGMTAEVNAGKEPEDRERQANLQEFVDSITTFVSDSQEEGRPASLSDFLQMVSLLTDRDKEREDESECITLMTLHAAKGLEFPIVFIVGLEENLFPSEMAIDEGNVEEERRLFYVGVTRAAERLFLTWSHSRMRFGRFENNRRSRFVGEIDSRYLVNGGKSRGSLMFGRSSAPRQQDFFDAAMRRTTNVAPATERREDAAPQRRMRPVANYQSPYTASKSLSPDASLKVGDHIEHTRFGLGTVTAIEGTGLDTKATVQFENAGSKQLLLRFAKFIKR